MTQRVPPICCLPCRSPRTTQTCTGSSPPNGPKTIRLAAINWAKQLPDGTMVKQTVLQNITSTWAQSDPAAAMGFALTLPAGSQQDNLVSSVTSSWAANDLDGARAWAQGLPSGPSRSQAISSIVSSWANSDPQAAAAFVGQLTDPGELNQATSSLVNTWARENPQAAAAWLMQQPVSDPTGQSHGQLARTWAGTDPNATGTWVESLPTGKSHDMAAQVSCPTNRPNGPSVRGEMARYHSGRKHLAQRGAAGRLSMVSGGSDSSEATWVAQSQLPDQFKTSFANRK